VKGKRVVYRAAEHAYQASKFAPDAVDPETKENIRKLIAGEGKGSANRTASLARQIAHRLERLGRDDLMSIPSSEVVLI